MVDHIQKTGLLIMLLMINSAVYGHHSFAVEFTAQRTVTIRGTVAEVWFRNPHVRYYVEVINADEQIENWDVRTSSPSLLVRKGWTKNTISIGDNVVIKGHPGREGRKLLSVISIRLADDSVLGQGPGPAEYASTPESQP